jgi:hypothetical protein
MENHYIIIGFILVPLSIIHIIFPRYFNWQKEFGTLSLINRQMVYVHTFFIALVVLLMGILCITSAQELTHTNLGRKISLAMGIFWTFRLFIQLFGYSTVLWKGKSFETAVHVLFIIMWTYMSTIFLATYFSFKF